MNCDICADYIYAHNWFPQDNLKICEKCCFEGSSESAPKTERNINNFDPNNSMSKIQEIKDEIAISVLLKQYNNLSDIDIESSENPKRMKMLHSMIRDLIKTSKINQRDTIALLKQVTLHTIMSAVEEKMETMEEQDKKSYQEEFK